MAGYRHRIGPAVLAGFTMVMTITLAAAGCGGENAATNDQSSKAGPATSAAISTIPAGDIDPCGVITKADAAALMGEAVGDGTPMPAERGISCSYTTVQQPPRTMVMTIISPCSMADYANIGKGEPVEGIGMHAAWDKTTMYVHTMQNSCLIMTGTAPRGTDPANDQPALEMMKNMAQMMIDRMAGMMGGSDSSGASGGMTGGSATSTGMMGGSGSTGGTSGSGSSGSSGGMSGGSGSGSASSGSSTGMMGGSGSGSGSSGGMMGGNS